MRKSNDELKNRIFDYIQSYVEKNGFSPSYDNIASTMNCSKGTVFTYIKRLEESANIYKLGHNQIVTKDKFSEVERVPIVGCISCGMPSFAQENIIDYMAVDKSMLGSGEYFGLIAKGNSMINIGINEGDIVIVRKQNYADNGCVVVAMIIDEYTGEATCTLKRLYKEKNLYRLHPENDYMEDLWVDALEVLGIAVKVIKDIK